MAKQPVRKIFKPKMFKAKKIKIKFPSLKPYKVSKFK